MARRPQLSHSLYFPLVRLAMVSCLNHVLTVEYLLASGLLWLSELIEENTKIAKTIGQRGIYVRITFRSCWRAAN